MKNLSTYFVAALMGVAVMGCSKKKEETPAPSKTELLTNKNWIISAQTVSPGINIGGTTVTDLYAQSAACDKDDFVRFETPNVFKQDEGATKCSPSDPQTLTGTWSYNADQTIITVTPQGSTASSANVQDLTATSLKLSQTQTSGNVTYTFTTTYRKG